MKRGIYLLFILCVTSPTTISGRSSIHFCLLVSIYSVVRLKINVYIKFIFPHVFLKCKVPLLSKRNLFLAIAYFTVIAFLSCGKRRITNPARRRWNSDSAAVRLNNFALTTPQHISGLNVRTSQFIVRRINVVPKTNRIFNFMIKRRAGQNLLFLTLSQ